MSCAMVDNMADQKFDIVFRGDIVIGKPLTQVKKNLAHLFKIPPEKVGALFSGKSVVLKKGVDAATAKKYQTVLTKAGAVTSVVAQAAEGQSEKPRTRKLTIAPLGVNIAPRSASNTKTDQPVAIDTSGISLKAQSGNLVDAGEVTAEEAEQVELPTWDVADVGSDIGDGSQQAETSPLPVPDFDVAEAGAQMGQAKEVTAAIDVSKVDFDVAPAGSDMGEKKSDKKPLSPNTDHIKLS